jgi:poly[(R)-3-hydroxyalkanoate] polymerase subunit PhaC
MEDSCMADKKHKKDKKKPLPPDEILEQFMQKVLEPGPERETTNSPEHGTTNSPEESTTAIGEFQEAVTPYIHTITLFLDLLQGKQPGSPEHANPVIPEPAESNGEEVDDTNDPPLLFDHVTKWLELGCEYNKRVLTDTLSSITNPSERYNGLIDSFTTLSNHLMEGGSNASVNILNSHLSLMQKHLELSENLVRRLAGKKLDPVISPAKTDHRFNDEQWDENVLFDFIKQSYLLNSKALMSASDHLELTPKNKAFLDYCLRQISSAMSPSNFALINPEVLKKIKDTNGENIYLGIKQLLEDHAKSPQFLNISMSDTEQFKLGEHLATTKGEVIFENELMQLIQYQATTKKTFSIPLLIIPSWVNKYYILDLSPDNSFVQWAVDKGFTVFMISWVNPDRSHRNIEFDDYLKLGILTAVDTIKEVTGEQKINAVGYCLGGILLATALSYLSHHNNDSIAAATYLATSLDYTDPGDIGIFLNEKSINSLEIMMEKEGYLDGRLLSVTFNLLRENELYWNYYIQNYLKGEKPKAFDVLHWNSDNTNVPAKTHSFVLRDLHLNNGLIEKNQISLLDTPIDLESVTNPMYILATDKDHIAKWESAYSATQLHSGDKRFVLAGSGHIAGVINPPLNNKYYYLINSDLPECPKEWLSSATKSDGSWWNDWVDWMNPHGGEQVKARKISAKHVVESAPGRYVLRRLS